MARRVSGGRVHGRSRRALRPEDSGKTRTACRATAIVATLDARLRVDTVCACTRLNRLFTTRRRCLSVAHQDRQLAARAPKQPNTSLVSNETARRAPILTVGPDTAKTAASTTA